jgi:hypothetical protein
MNDNETVDTNILIYEIGSQDGFKSFLFELQQKMASLKGDAIRKIMLQ